MRIIIDGAKEIIPSVWETVDQRATVVARFDTATNANWIGSGRCESLRQTFDVRAPMRGTIAGVTATVIQRDGSLSQWAAAVIAPLPVNGDQRTVIHEQTARALSRTFGAMYVVDPRLLASCALATVEELHSLAIVGMLPMATRAEAETVEEVAAIIGSIEARAGYTWVG